MHAVYGICLGCIIIFMIKLFEKKKSKIVWHFRDVDDNLKPLLFYQLVILSNKTFHFMVLHCFFFVLLTIHPNIHLYYTTFTIKLSIWLQYLSAFFSSISLNATIYVMVHIRFRFHFYIWQERSHGEYILYTPHTHTYFICIYTNIILCNTFISSSALETNKPITNTALNRNNCMRCALEITQFCWWFVYMKKISYLPNNGRCETYNMYPILFHFIE